MTKTKKATKRRKSQSASKARLEGMFTEEPTDAQLADACMWERHDFGLLSDAHRESLMFEMREHWRAIWKACNTPGRGKEFLPSNAALSRAGHDYDRKRCAVSPRRPRTRS